MHYYYTRWTFNHTPDGLDGPGPYQSRWTSESTPTDFISGVLWVGMKEFTIRVFNSKEEMDTYWDSVN